MTEWTPWHERHADKIELVAGIGSWPSWRMEDCLMAELCPFCGAYSRRACEMEDDTGGECLWDESEELDPDRLREDRDERNRLAQKGSSNE